MATAYQAAFQAAKSSDPTQLWQVTTIAPNGKRVTTHGHTTIQAVREMLRRRKRGHRLPSPCATPETQTAEGQSR